MPSPRALPDIEVFRRRENHGEPVDDRRLRPRIRSGELTRIGPGSVVETAPWNALAPIDRHALRVVEAAARVQPGTVFSVHAAAAIWGIDKLGGWPSRIDVTVDPQRSGRSAGLIHRRARDMETVAVVPWGRHFLTTPAQTAVDITAAMPFLEGIVSADQALWARREGGALTTIEDIRAAAALLRRGNVRVRRMIGFARAGADSVRESESRVLIASLGFPEPVLQRRFSLSDGGVAFVDFYFPSHDHIGEFDGVGKYVDPRLTRGRTPAQVVVEEKRREDELRRQVRRFSRWGTKELASPRRLYDILVAAGLPSSLPRPGR